MSVFANADGMSFISIGFGGEVDSILPDVCLAYIGPAVVPTRTSS